MKLFLAAFDTYIGLSDFLYESDIVTLANDVLLELPGESLSVVLVLGVIALGGYIMATKQTSANVDVSDSRQVFSEACIRVSPFLLGHSSLLNLQVWTVRYRAIHKYSLPGVINSSLAGAVNSGKFFLALPKDPGAPSSHLGLGS